MRMTTAVPAAVEWRFDGPPPSPAPGAAADVRGWEGLRGVSGLAVRQGRLVGRTQGDFPILHVERKTGLGDRDGSLSREELERLRSLGYIQ